jgi:protein required for attachment to host cells
MSNVWVVVADASRARFFRGSSINKPLEEFHDMVNEEMRQDELDLVTDKPGRFHDDTTGNTPQRSSAEPTARQHSKESFGKDIGKFIEKNRASGKFKHISLIAEPKLLGYIRKEFSNATEEAILEEVNKNLTQQDEETIRGKLTRLPSGFK